MPRKLRILMVAPEARPYARGAELGEAVSALAQALAARFHRVDVLVPWAPQRWEGAPPALKELCQLDIPVGARQVHARVLTPEGEETALRWLLLDIPEFFDRKEIYGTGDADYHDNCSRFVALSRAATLVGQQLKVRYDVLHAHDWPAALAPYYNREIKHAGEPGSARTTCFTFHTLAYQGLFWALDLPLLGLGPEHYSTERLEFFGKLSFLKAGMVSADRITTVSPTYAREVLSAESGMGFDGLLKSRGATFSGIINGIDAGRWDPDTDKALQSTYTNPNSPRRENCCKALHAQLGLTRDERPLFSVMATPSWSKGLDAVAAVTTDLVNAGGRLLVLGNAEPPVQFAFNSLAAKHPGAVVLRPPPSEVLVRQVMAGSDFFMMPSRVEPCGLLQLVALRYGAVPLVRRCGGLRDTVLDIDAQQSVGNGVAYVGEGGVPLLGALNRALALHKEPSRYKTAQYRAAEADVSAAPPAARYEQLFLDALAADKVEPQVSSPRLQKIGV